MGRFNTPYHLIIGFHHLLADPLLPLRYYYYLNRTDLKSIPFCYCSNTVSADANHIYAIIFYFTSAAIFCINKEKEKNICRLMVDAAKTDEEMKEKKIAVTWRYIRVNFITI